ncbi:unnamed protein product [Rhizopus stolonifer]
MSESDSRAQSSKRKKYAQLHHELDKLSKNMEDLYKNFNKMNEQAPSLLKTSTFHTAMSMSSRSVLNITNDSDN